MVNLGEDLNQTFSNDLEAVFSGGIFLQILNRYVTDYEQVDLIYSFIWFETEQGT